MKMIDKNALERLRWRFPAGSEVELQRMDDVQAPPPGTRGKVMFIDDDGTIHVAWNTGSTLGVVNGVDEILPVCPICQNAYSAHPAISRRDSETLICPDCGMREAMGAVGFKKEFQEEVIAEVKEKQSPKIKIRFEDLPKCDQDRLLRAIEYDIRKMMKEKETPKTNPK